MSYVSRDLEIPVEILQRALDGKNLAEIAYRLGWMRTSRGEYCGDSSRLRRTIGLRASYRYHGKPHTQTHVSYELAGEILRAAGLYPVDFDL